MEKMKAIACALLLLTGFTATAQEIEFDKKSGEFSTPNGVVAKLNSERVKAGKNSFGLGVGKNYFVTDAAGTTEYLGYMLQRFNDTLGGPTRWYYTMRCTPLGLTASRLNFTGSLNTFKEVGELVLSKHLLQPDGKMAEAAMRDYFASESADLPTRYAAINDSLSKLINIPSTPPERNMRKPITANQFGKIGQDNTVIGFWELVETPPENGLGSPDYHFVIRNLNNGIVCVAWLSLGGAETNTFTNGQRKQDRIALDLIKDNPIQNKEQFAIRLAENLVRAGLL